MQARWVAAILVLGGLLVGCQTNVAQEKERAQQKWDVARASILAGCAEEQLRAGELDKAFLQAKESLALAPKLGAARAVIGKVLIERGQFSSAVFELEKALEDEPRSATLAYLVGVAYERSGNLPEAYDAYRRACRLDPTHFEAVLASAEAQAGMGKHREALELVEGRLDQAGDDPAAYELCGRLAMLLRDYSKAESYFRTACVLDKGNVVYLKALGRAHFMNGHYREAVRAMEQVVSAPDYEASYTVYAVLGDSYLALGRGTAARDAYFTATELAPSEPKIWIGLARAYLGAEEPHRAVLAARQALRLDDGLVDAKILRAFAQLECGRVTQAIRDLTVAVRRHPDSSMLRCLLGRSYAARGEVEPAARHLMAAVKLDADNQAAKALLKTLREEPQKLSMVK